MFTTGKLSFSIQPLNSLSYLQPLSLLVLVILKFGFLQIIYFHDRLRSGLSLQNRHCASDLALNVIHRHCEFLAILGSVKASRLMIQKGLLESDLLIRDLKDDC